MMWPESWLCGQETSAGQAVVAGSLAFPAISTAGNLSHTLLQSTPFEPGFLGITYDAGEPRRTGWHW